MQTVEKTEIKVADDGRTEPMENGNTGENQNTGSDAESQNAAKREWEELIAQDRYRAQYAAHVSEIIKKRLRSEKQSSELLGRAASILGLEDPEQLPERIEKLILPAKRDWAAEQDAVREKYPEFDLQKQLEIPAFASLLQGFAAIPDVSLTKVYELYELDRLKADAAQQAAAQAARQIMGAVQIRHERPHENGLRDAASDTGRASRLTRAQRAVLAERAAKGEHITF